MKVSVNIPDKLFEEFIKGVEEKTGKPINGNILSTILKIPAYEIKYVNEEDMQLYKWLAAIVCNELVGEN